MKPSLGPGMYAYRQATDAWFKTAAHTPRMVICDITLALHADELDQHIDTQDATLISTL